MVHRRCLLDLDGVVVDFQAGACRLHNIETPYLDPKNYGKSRMEDIVGIPRDAFFRWMGEGFWANLPWTPDGKHIVDLVERAFGKENVCILTKPLKVYGCLEGKTQWIRDNMPDYYYGNRYLFGAAKEFAAGPDVYLVDDNDDNIRNFNAWGGNGVIVPRPWNSHHHLANTTFRYIDINLPQSTN